MAEAIETTQHRWLLLIHQLPTKPAYLRVKVWRRLQALGAVTVKNSVYALPANEQTQEDLEWLLKEITAGGGEALICEARLVDGLSDQEVRALFNAARDADYASLAAEARALGETSFRSSCCSPRPASAVGWLRRFRQPRPTGRRSPTRLASPGRRCLAACI